MIYESGNTRVNALCAKSKVALLKTISFPRLELMGVLIAARLTKAVISSLKVNIENKTFWTDSTIVLSWLKIQLNKLKTFKNIKINPSDQNA